MKLLTYVFVLGLILAPNVGFGQASETSDKLKNDVGIFISTVRGLPSLEYRIGLNERDRFRIGLHYGIETSNFFSEGQILSASDSSVLRRYNYTQNLRPTLRFGMDRKLSVKYLSLGVDVLVRYTNRSVDYFENNTILDEQGNWIAETPPLPVNNTLTSNNTSVRYHFLMPAVRGIIMAEFPLGNSFLFSAYYDGLIGPNMFIGETRRNDPSNEIPRPSDLTIEVSSSIGIGVRYMLNSKQL